MNEMKNMQNVIATIVTMMFLGMLSLHAGTSLDAEIMKIKSAPPKERVKLMNNLKKRLFSLNRAERIRAIRKLRTSIAHSNKGITHKKVRRSAKASHTKRVNSIVTHNRGIEHLQDRIEIANHHSVINVVNDMGGVIHHSNHRVEQMIEQNIVKAHREVTIDRPSVNSRPTVEPNNIDEHVAVDNGKTDNSKNDIVNNKPLDTLKDNRDKAITNSDISPKQPIVSHHIKNTEVVFKTDKAVTNPNIPQSKPIVSPHIKNTEVIFKTDKAVTNPAMPDRVDMSGKVEMDNNRGSADIQTQESHNSYENHSESQPHNDAPPPSSGGESSAGNGGRW